MQYGELIDFLQHVGKDPSRLIFEDELTGIYNRRYLHSYFEHKVEWDGAKDFPISLLAMDLDFFKKINDTYGHDAGDEALIWVAKLIREVEGEDGHPVRYGGDEFMLLLPHRDLDAAEKAANRLIQLAKEKPLPLSDGKGSVKISLSIGVASARDDAATGPALIRKADVALYMSKKGGRGRVSVAGRLTEQETFPKTTLHRLNEAQIAGRGAELNAVSEALGALSLNQSSFLVLEGAPGMGKTTLLETIRRSLGANPLFELVKVSGGQEEGLRPYYVSAAMVHSLMNRLPDKGVSVLEGMTRREHHYLDLGHVLPQLETEQTPADEDEARLREGIFATVLQLVQKLLDGKQLVLLIDDLQFVDEATLVLLRVLFQRGETPALVCATLTEALAPGAEGEAPPWQRFEASRPADVNIEKIVLKPLSAEDIVEHLQGVFPGIELPDGFENELARLTQGNPLFLGEIVRKLVLDQKLSLVGQTWKVESPEEGYLPRSLEQIVHDKIAALDQEGREILEQVSTMGETVPLSMLTGASHIAESKVLEFLDRAEALGLLRDDFEINDETMRFLSKRVLELAYGGINDDRREQLHQQVGAYQEELYQKRLGVSASILAYHFKRSADQERAGRCDRIQTDYRHRAFNAEEAAAYTADPLADEEDEPEDHRLSAESLAKLPNFLRTFLTGVRSIQLYPPGSQPIKKAYQSSMQALRAVLAGSEFVHLSRSQNVLLVNEQKIDVGEYRLLANSYLELLDRMELGREHGVDAPTESARNRSRNSNAETQRPQSERDSR